MAHIDVLQYQERILPPLRKLMAIDGESTPSSKAAECRAVHAKKTKVVEERLLPFWKKRLNELELATDLTSAIIFPDNNIVFDGSSSQIRESTIIMSGTFLQGARDPLCLNSIVVADSAFGRSIRGNNPPNFDERHFNQMMKLAEGIDDEKSGLVIDSLREFQSIATQYDIEMHGKIFEDTAAYAPYNDLAPIANLVDNYYLPAVQKKETAGVSVGNSIVYGAIDVFPSVLGGEISNSIVATGGDAFDNGHIIVSQSFLMEKRGRRTQLIEGHVRFGKPEEARDTVQAVKGLRTPLARFVV